MIDEPLPTTSGIDDESESSDERPSDGQSHGAQPDAPRPVRESATGPDRTTDSPPDPAEDKAADEPEPEPIGSDEDTEEPEPLEYRLERLRLWRTVVTLAVVVARLVRSL